MRKRIVDYLGEDIYSDSIAHQKDITNGHQKEEFIGPLTEKDTANVFWNPNEVKSKLDDWYH